MAGIMKEIRTSLGLEQKEVAAELGIPVRTYGAYERGERTLSLDMAAQIADVFQVTIDQLLGRTYYMSPAEVERREMFMRLKQKARDVQGIESVDTSLEERELLMLFRKMDAAHRDLIILTARSFTALTEKEGDSIEGTVRSGAVDAVTK